MIKRQLPLLGVLIIPMQSYANCFIDIGMGDSSGNITIQQVENGGQTFSTHDKSGSTKSLSAGCSISKRISVSIDYVEFLEKYDLLGSDIELESYSYGISSALDLYQSKKVNFSVGAGYGQWKSKPQLSEAHWDFSSTPVVLEIKDKSYSIDGYTPYAYVNLNYSFNKKLSLGIKYNYYNELGYIESIIDRDALSVGDLVGALKVAPPKNSSVEIYSIYFRWLF